MARTRGGRGRPRGRGRGRGAGKREEEASDEPESIPKRAKPALGKNTKTNITKRDNVYKVSVINLVCRSIRYNTDDFLTTLFLQDRLRTMSRERLEALAMDFYKRDPSAALAIVTEEVEEASPGPSRASLPAWCKCSKCDVMPNTRENECCERSPCISTLPVQLKL